MGREFSPARRCPLVMSAVVEIEACKTIPEINDRIAKAEYILRVAQNHKSWIETKGVK